MKRSGAGRDELVDVVDVVSLFGWKSETSMSKEEAPAFSFCSPSNLLDLIRFWSLR